MVYFMENPKIPSFEVDDDWWYPYDSGNLQIMVDYGEKKNVDYGK